MNLLSTHKESSVLNNARTDIANPFKLLLKLTVGTRCYELALNVWKQEGQLGICQQVAYTRYLRSQLGRCILVQFIIACIPGLLYRFKTEVALSLENLLLLSKIRVIIENYVCAALRH